LDLDRRWPTPLHSLKHLDEGATLSLHEPVALPKKFGVAFSLRKTESKCCELVCRRGITAGVNFE
jgi:hypothetical protein